MTTRYSLALIFATVLLSGVATAQEVPVQPPPPGPRMNPVALLRLRDQMTFELQQTQRTLGFIDPSDTQLTATLKEQQAELINQLKEVTAQLRAQGIPLEPEAAPTVPRTAPTEADLPPVAKAEDPTLVPGGTPQPATDPNLLIPHPPGVAAPPPLRQFPSASPATPPTEFDQTQIWADSPWSPRPSRELNELKQTVDALRRELAEMKETVKALETQIQLLNRNILLSQPKPAL